MTLTCLLKKYSGPFPQFKSYDQSLINMEFGIENKDSGKIFKIRHLYAHVVPLEEEEINFHLVLQDILIFFAYQSLVIKV